MCSIGDDIDETDETKYMPQEKPSASTKCNKCRAEPPCVLLRSKDKYCKACFLAGTVHKFKSSLGKHKLIRPNDRVLIVHKGGHPSSALLHFIRTGLDLGTHKKLRFEPVVLHIDERLDLSLDERLAVQESIKNESAKLNLPIHFGSILQVDPTNEECPPKNEDGTVLKAFLAKQKGATNKTEYLRILLRQLYVRYAVKLNCKFIFTPDISMDVSAQILTNLTLGRGSQIPLDAGFSDCRNEVKILRPLRMLDIKELAFYNHFNNVEPVSARKANENVYGSVQSLIEKFVGELQVSFPATVTTILKTGDKLGVSKENLQCKFCMARLDAKSSELSSAESTRFSHLISTGVSHETALLKAVSPDVEDSYCFTCRKLQH